MKIRQAKKIVRNLIKYPHSFEPKDIFADSDVMLINTKNNSCKLFYTGRQVANALRMFRPEVRIRISDCQKEWYEYIETHTKPNFKEVLNWIKYAAK